MQECRREGHDPPTGLTCRETSLSGGAIMGWSYHRKRRPSRGRFYRMRSSVLTPVPGLLAAGHWAFSPGGAPVAVMTGRLAAEHLLNKAHGGRGA